MTEYITVAKVLKSHGVHGMVKVLLLTDFPERFSKMTEVVLLLKNGSRKKYHLEKTIPHNKNTFLIKFKETGNIEEADRLRGSLLQVTRNELVDLPPYTYYIFDILGLVVFTTGGEMLGKIEDVIQTGANDVYVVNGKNGSVLVPALKKVIREVDLKGRRMVVDLPEGL